jgi:hypothetical protein
VVLVAGAITADEAQMVWRNETQSTNADDILFTPNLRHARYPFIAAGKNKRKL